jgi:hypothetical protein
MIDLGSVLEDVWCGIARRLISIRDPLLTLPREARTPDRRPVRAIALYDGSADFAWGLNKHWVEQGVPWLLDTMDTACKRGFRRFMWSLPAGRLETDVPWPSAQWQLLDSSGIIGTISASVRQDLANLITPWLMNHPEVQVIIYLGGVIKSAYDRTTDGAWVPDPWCPRDRRIMHLNFDGFVALSPPGRHQIGFWFDNSSPAEKRRGEYRVVEWLRAQSLWVGMEAVANDNDNDDFSTNKPIAPYVRKVAMFGVRHFYDPTVFPTPAPNAETLRDARARWRFDPQTSEIGFFLWGYPEQLPHGLTLSEGEAMLRNYHERGFILGTYVERWEEVIMNIVSGG